jgi:hypothetical protein
MYEISGSSYNVDNEYAHIQYITSQQLSHHTIHKMAAVSWDQGGGCVALSMIARSQVTYIQQVVSLQHVDQNVAAVSKFCLLS